MTESLDLRLTYIGGPTKHFTESRQQIAQTFASAGLEHRLLWLPPGQPTTL